MKVLLIGSTGVSGTVTLAKLLQQGHEVTAFARNPEDVTTKHEKLRVVKGNTRDLASVEAACAGQDAVMMCFGPRSLKKDDVFEVSCRNVVVAMKKTGVKRLVTLSALGMLDSDRYTPLVFRIFRAILLRNIWPDKERGEQLILDSDLDYTNVRPGQLIGGAARGGIKASLVGTGIKPKMTRADLADFMIAQLTTNEWSRKNPIIGY